MLTDPVAFTGRHNRGLAQHQQARYHLRQGMAKVALEAKRSGRPVEDSVGRPLRYANEMNERHGTRTLEQWARGAHRASVVVNGMDFRCAQCHRVKRRGKCRCTDA